MLTPGGLNNSNPIDVKNPLAVYPTFAPRFPFTKETVTTSEPSNTTTRKVAELELELLDVLDRLAQSYTNTTHEE